MELVQFYNNDADVCASWGNRPPGGAAQALEGIESLSRPAPSVGIERPITSIFAGGAQGRSIQGPWLYRQSFEMYQRVEGDGQANSFPSFTSVWRPPGERCRRRHGESLPWRPSALQC
jgi:hypothetical protein